MFDREYLYGGFINRVDVDIFRIYTFTSNQHQGPVKISYPLHLLVLLQTCHSGVPVALWT